MSEYRDLARKEAKAYYEANREAFENDTEDFGGGSANRNLAKWMDRTETLSARIADVSAKWGLKEFHWVQANTRNKNTQGGDPRSNAFASFLKDVMHEIKKLAKS